MGIGLSYPGVVPPWGCGLLHVITAWGDEGGEETPDENPSYLKVTDSDDKFEETDGDVMTYTYDDYDNPRHPNQGEGWYLDDYRIDVHPYIMNVVTLHESKYTFPCDCDPVIVRGYYKVSQRYSEEADQLKYYVDAEGDPIYGYAFELRKWEPHGDSTVTEYGDPPHRIRVEWDLSENPVPGGAAIGFMSELALCNRRHIRHRFVRFRPVSSGLRAATAEYPPEIGWSLETPDVPDPDAPYLCGGHVTGAFEIYSDAMGDTLIAEVNLMHEYNYYSDPELHTFMLYSPDTSETVYIGDMRFGHSYGYLELDSLEALGPGDWIEETGTIKELLPGDTITVSLNWEGLLPYPQPIWTDSGDGGCPPAALSLYQNFPNPFNPTTTIRYDLPTDCHVTLEVFDVLGRKITTLIDERQEAGVRTVAWHVDNGIASGIYFYRLEADGSTVTRKMVILR